MQTTHPSPPSPAVLSSEPDVPVDRRGVDELADCLTGQEFAAYRRREEYRDNIREGHPEYNTGGYESEDLRHSPHTLDQCQRKQWYREKNTIQETESPEGIFETGSWIEEDIVAPWLDAVARRTGWYLRNDIWVEATVESDIGDLQLAGKTDPCFVDDASVPMAITEIKSKASLSNLKEPSRQHKAQLHAYLHAAKAHFDLEDYLEGYLIYVGKKRFDVEVFNVEFDPEFFQEFVVEWCESLSWHRIERIMPRAEPCHEWECKLCEYSERCGAEDESDGVFEDVPAGDPLPLTKYPREAVIEYLRARNGAKLTPTLAHQYPDLAERHAVHDWHCRECRGQFTWDRCDWDGDVDQPPWCPECIESEGVFSALSGFLPS